MNVTVKIPISFVPHCILLHPPISQTQTHRQKGKSGSLRLRHGLRRMRKSTDMCRYIAYAVNALRQGINLISALLLAEPLHTETFPHTHCLPNIWNGGSKNDDRPSGQIDIVNALLATTSDIPAWTAH